LLGLEQSWQTPWQPGGGGGRLETASPPHAGLDLSAWEDRGKAAQDIQQQGLDKLRYLPLVFKNFCGFYMRPNQRFGFGAPRRPVDQYDVSLLHAGWYHTFWFQADPAAPDGLEFAQTIRLCDAATGPYYYYENDCVPSQEAIENYAAARPGTLSGSSATSLMLPFKIASLPHAMPSCIMSCMESSRAPTRPQGSPSAGWSRPLPHACDTWT